MHEKLGDQHGVLRHLLVRRGFRAGKYVATFRFKWSPGPSPGFLVRWVNPGDWLAVIVKAADNKAWVYKRVNDGILLPATKPELIANLEDHLRDTQRRPNIVKRYFPAEPTQYAAG